MKFLNTSFGYQSIKPKINTSSANTAFGSRVLSSLTIGKANIGVMHYTTAGTVMLPP